MQAVRSNWNFSMTKLAHLNCAINIRLNLRGELLQADISRRLGQCAVRRVNAPCREAYPRRRAVSAAALARIHGAGADIRAGRCVAALK